MMDYQQFSEVHSAAYAAFKHIYQQQTPPPQKIDAKRENWFEVIVLGVLVAASVIVSGSRTIREFGGDFVGVAGFIMLELGVVAYAYIRTSKYYDKTRHNSVKALLTRGMWLAFTVAIVANVHATFKANGIEFAPVNIVIFLFLAIGAPTLALIAGDTLAMLVVTDKYRQRDADKEYEESLKAYAHDMNEAWKNEQGTWGVSIKVARKAATVVSIERDMSTVQVSNGQSIGQTALPAASTLGHKKVANASELARAYFIANPNALDIPARELVDVIGAGKSTINNVQQEMRGQNQNDA